MFSSDDSSFDSLFCAFKYRSCKIYRSCILNKIVDVLTSPVDFFFIVIVNGAVMLLIAIPAYLFFGLHRCFTALDSCLSPNTE
jgi:uncharacterized membrane protein